MKTKLLSVLLTLLTTVAYAQKVLIVSTNVGSINNTENGTFLMEIAYPLSVFKAAGVEVDILTPKGGKAALYHRGELSEELAKIQSSDYFKQKTENTLSPGQINTKDYVGIYYPGGGGQFYDVVDNKEIAQIAARIYEKGGMIGAAGHGPASLINIQLSNKEFLVQNKKITCFPKAYSAKWIPIDWEALLKQHGAEVVLPTTDIEKDKGVLLLDKANRFATGSFAENAQWVAEQLVQFAKEKK